MTPAEDARQVGDAEMVAGATQFEQGARYADALATFQAAEQTYAAGGHPREAVMARLNQARCLSALGRSEEAIAVYEAVAAQHAVPDLQLAWEAWGGLADHYDRIGEPDRAVALFERLLAETTALGDELRTAYFENWVGRKLAERGDTGRGLPLMDSAVRRYEALGHTQLVASALMVMGAHHHQAHEKHQAVDCFTRAAAAYDEVGDAEGAAAARHNLEVLAAG